MKILFAIALSLAIPTINAQEVKKEAETEVIKGEKALKGYWIPDRGAILEMMLTNAADAIKAGLVTEETLKAQASKMSNEMLVHFGKDSKTSMHSASGKEEGTYKITAKRPAKNEIDIEIVSKKSGVEKSTLIVEGDTLIMKAENGPGTFKLKRMAEKDAPARIAEIAKLKK